MIVMVVSINFMRDDGLDRCNKELFWMVLFQEFKK